MHSGHSSLLPTTVPSFFFFHGKSSQRFFFFPCTSTRTLCQVHNTLSLGNKVGRHIPTSQSQHPQSTHCCYCIHKQLLSTAYLAVSTDRKRFGQKNTRKSVYAKGTHKKTRIASVPRLRPCFCRQEHDKQSCYRSLRLFPAAVFLTGTWPPPAGGPVLAAGVFASILKRPLSRALLADCSWSSRCPFTSHPDSVTTMLDLLSR